MEEIDLYLEEAKEQMGKAVEHTRSEFAKIRAGKVMPSMVDGLTVDYYGAVTPISQVANVSSSDARTLLIKPWEKHMLQEIEKSIQKSDLGINPQSDGEVIRLVVPPLTEERRRDLAKQAKAEAEQGRVRVRAVRKETNDELKKLQKDGAPEDAVKAAEEQVQKLTDSFVSKIDELLEKKEADIMKV